MPKLKIPIKDWYGLHRGFSLEIKPGFTALVGPNGAGKTTMLQQIREFAQKSGIQVCFLPFPGISGTGGTLLRGCVWVRSGRAMPFFAMKHHLGYSLPLRTENIPFPAVFFAPPLTREAYIHACQRSFYRKFTYFPPYFCERVKLTTGRFGPITLDARTERPMRSPPHHPTEKKVLFL